MQNHSKHKELQSDKFYGNYRAKVVDNVDKDEEGNIQRTGRVKIRVYSIHGDDVPDEALPWAIYSDPMMGGLEDLGGFIIPNIDSDVWVFFEEGDHDQPVYFAGAPSRPDFPTEKDNEKDQDGNDIAYPKNKIFKTKAGFIIEIDDTEENTRFRIKQPNGNEKIIKHNGDVVELINGVLEETVEKEVTQIYKSTLDIDVEGKVTFKAPEMQFGEDSKVEQSVLGKKLEDWINNELLPWLNEHTHTGNLGSPTSVPISPFEAGTAEPSGAVWSKVNTNQ